MPACVPLLLAMLAVASAVPPNNSLDDRLKSLDARRVHERAEPVRNALRDLNFKGWRFTAYVYAAQVDIFRDKIQRLARDTTRASLRSRGESAGIVITV